MRQSLRIALIAVFSALHAVLFLLPFAPWRNWAIYIEPIEGIVLGPWAGFTAALFGSVTARTIKPDSLWMFGIVAEPLGALVCGLLAKGHWKTILVLYIAMLSAYFAHPLGRWLPVWAIIDIFVAFALFYPAAKLSKDIYQKDTKRLQLSAGLISFIGVVTDSLARVFLLVPVGLYSFFGWPPEAIYSEFVLGAANSYFEDLLAVIISSIVIVPLLIALRKIPGFKYPAT